MSGELGATGFFKHLLGLQIDISLYANLMRFALLTGIQHWLTQGNQGGNIDTQHEGAYFVVRASLVSSERLGGGVTLTYSWEGPERVWDLYPQCCLKETHCHWQNSARNEDWLNLTSCDQVGKDMYLSLAHWKWSLRFLGKLESWDCARDLGSWRRGLYWPVQTVEDEQWRQQCSQKRLAGDLTSALQEAIPTNAKQERQIWPCMWIYGSKSGANHLPISLTT